MLFVHNNKVHAKFDGNICIDLIKRLRDDFEAIKTLQRLITYNEKFHEIEEEYNDHIKPAVSYFMNVFGLYLYSCEDFDRKVKELQKIAEKCDETKQNQYDALFIRWQQIIQSHFTSIDIVAPLVRENLVHVLRNFNDLTEPKRYFEDIFIMYKSARNLYSEFVDEASKI